MYKKLTEEEKKALEKFPAYDESKPETWVGSREYWESIFTAETNRDPGLHKAFSELHKKMVDLVIQFCEEHGLENVDEVHFAADGLSGSYGHHEWTCFTDSSMNLVELKDNVIKGWDAPLPDRDNPFLFEM